MKKIKNTTLVLLIVISACSTKNFPDVKQGRLEYYWGSENECFDAIFSNEEVVEGVQPVFTKVELDILDGLVCRLSDSICREFDQKCQNWMSCWADVDPNILLSNPQYALQCNKTEYLELIDFCRQQDESILLLFYQLASRAHCPYDLFLLRPILDLSGTFPEYAQYWADINTKLKEEKPDLQDRTCNETTIWYTRKMLESRYGYTYANRLASLFDTRRLLLMAR